MMKEEDEKIEMQSPNLVVYFSPQSHTRKIARYLANGISADIQEIVPDKPYSKRDLNWRRFFARCNREHRNNIFPAIDEPVVDLGLYAVIFLGFPIWYDQAPNVVKTFLQTCEWDGQKIVLFATSGGSGIENAAADLKRILGREKMRGAELFDSEVDPETVVNWGRGVLARLFASIKLGAEEYVEKEYSDPVPTVSEGIKYSQEPKFSRDLRDVRFSLEIPEEKDRYNQVEIQRTLSPGIRSILEGTDNGKELLRRLDLRMDQGFAGKMLRIIREKGLTEPKVYKAAQIDRKLFSKIVSDPDYKPSKDTCVALALALRLNLEEANDLLSRAGYTFSHSNKRDVILEYFFTAGKYNVYDVNIVLYQMGQKPLGRQG